MFINKHRYFMKIVLVFFFAPKIIINLLHQMFFWTVCVYKFLTKLNTLVCC